MENQKVLKLLSQYFGSYKAEWIQDSLYDLYTEPEYFPELTTARPCVLVGGRGTGKTTVLKSLSYRGQWEILNRKSSSKEDCQKDFKELNFYGFYDKINTTRTSSFKGIELKTEEWQKLFLHYTNVYFSQKLFNFLKWYSTNIEAIILDAAFYKKICKSLNIKAVSNINDVLEELENSIYDIEIYINNFDSNDKPKISTSNALEAVFSTVQKIPAFSNKTFFVILDEYENLEDEQQQVINTLIKHATNSFTFKIGVRKLGWRVRYTLNKNENLVSPSDYVLVDISEKFEEKQFKIFAKKICNDRIQRIIHEADTTLKSNIDVEDLFRPITLDQEAELLGVKKVVSSIRGSLTAPKVKEFSESMSDLELYVSDYLSKGAKRETEDYLIDVMEGKIPEYRSDEYAFASLFTINAGKPGIKKYYAGWNTYVKLSGKNIRYLLELIEQALILHVKNGEDILTPVSAKIQTLSSQSVGRKNLGELDGLSTHGAKLTKLVLGLGRVFQILAENSAGHAAEVNQFRVQAYAENEDEYISEEWLREGKTDAAEIVKLAVMHLAVIPFPRNKPKEAGETKEDVYQLHPIFAPYFVFSQRKRRDLVLREDHITGLIEKPKTTIRDIVKLSNRTIDNAKFPEQLKLFESYYNADS